MSAENERPIDNILRLRSHLKTGSLAERLVSARIEAGPSEATTAIRKVLIDRIEEVRQAHDVPDHKA